MNGHFLSFEVGQNEQMQFKFSFLYPQSKQSIHILILGLDLSGLVPNQTWASQGFESMLVFEVSYC